MVFCFYVEDLEVYTVFPINVVLSRLTGSALNLCIQEGLQPQNSLLFVQDTEEDWKGELKKVIVKQKLKLAEGYPGIKKKIIPNQKFSEYYICLSKSQHGIKAERWNYN